ncbi:MAG: hypothetical protein JWP87_4626 [Labilithrix sp.]|nr:hypothetical protein [Labilithrix sp.]
MARTLLGHEVVVRALVVTFAGAALALAAGCGAVETSTNDAPEAAIEGRATRPKPVWETSAAPAAICPEPVPLLVHHDAAGRVDRLHARLTARELPGSYLVDTGSLRSFVTHSGDEAAKTAETRIFCHETTLPIIARLRPGSTPDGEPQAGVLGSDLVAHGSVLDLDLVSGKLAWYQPAPEVPPGAVVLPIEYRNGWLVASGIKVQGRDVKLVVDTGASNVILVGKTPRMKEVREDTVDGTASPITLFHGDGEISFAGGPTRHVPVDRTDAFPTLEGLIEILGGDVAGLLGLTSMGRERIIIGKESLTLVMPPVSPNPL